MHLNTARPGLSLRLQPGFLKVVLGRQMITTHAPARSFVRFLPGLTFRLQ
jgi:hypothetical protein